MLLFYKHPAAKKNAPRRFAGTAEKDEKARGAEEPAGMTGRYFGASPVEIDELVLVGAESDLQCVVDRDAPAGVAVRVVEDVVSVLAIVHP